MSYSGKEIPRGFPRTRSTNDTARKGGRDDMSGKIGKGKFSTGYGGGRDSNPDGKQNNQKGNQLRKNIIGRGYRKNTPSIADSSITSASASTVKPISNPNSSKTK